MSIKQPLNKNYQNPIFIISGFILLLGIFFRIYNIAWGSPFFFHPDERNIASSVSQLNFPDQMNPHFFAYGTLPIYWIYQIGIINNLIQNLVFKIDLNIWRVSFEDAIIIGRLTSCFLSILTIFLIYKVGKSIGNSKVGILAALITSLSTGLIQYSHFMTFEIWLTFFTLLLMHFSLNYLKNTRFLNLVYISLTLGILISIKITSLALLPPIALLIIVKQIKSLKKSKINFYRSQKELMKFMLFLGIIMTTIYITCQYYWLDKTGFFNSINYESNVATGKLSVFYTQIFDKTIPTIYPLIKVYPFIANPIVFIAMLMSIPLFLIRLIKKWNLMHFILLLFLAITFIPQLFLYVKWTRYYIPTLPFLYLILSITTISIIKNFKSLPKYIFNSFILILLLSSIIFSFSYFKTVVFNKDTRVAALDWAVKNIPSNAKIVSEIYDLGIVPFNSHFSDIKLFNFYDLDTDPQKTSELSGILVNTEYIILPSQRILESRISNPDMHPLGGMFYKNLLSDSNNQLVYRTPCDIFCKILYLGNPTSSLEQTASVFDRPEVRIYRNK